MVVTGFLAAEVAGTSAVFLFIYWHRNRIAKKEMHRKMTLALVQTPLEITQAGHLLPPFPIDPHQQHREGDFSTLLNFLSTHPLICLILWCIIEPCVTR